MSKLDAQDKMNFMVHLKSGALSVIMIMLILILGLRDNWSISTWDPICGHKLHIELSHSCVKQVLVKSVEHTSSQIGVYQVTPAYICTTWLCHCEGEAELL